MSAPTTVSAAGPPCVHCGGRTYVPDPGRRAGHSPCGACDGPAAGGEFAVRVRCPAPGRESVEIEKRRRHRRYADARVEAVLAATREAFRPPGKVRRKFGCGRAVAVEVVFYPPGHVLAGEILHTVPVAGPAAAAA